MKKRTFPLPILVVLIGMITLFVIGGIFAFRFISQNNTLEKTRTQVKNYIGYFDEDISKTDNVNNPPKIKKQTKGSMQDNLIKAAADNHNGKKAEKGVTTLKMKKAHKSKTKAKYKGKKSVQKLTKNEWLPAIVD